MTSVRELACKYSRKFKPTLFDSGIGAKLPDAYRKFYDEWRNAPSKPVHFIPYTGKPWVRDEETGEVKRVAHRPLPLKYPQELNQVFTGGEAVVQGFLKKKKLAARVPKFWMPRVYRSVIYSEILDKYLSTLMTKRAVEEIHSHRGLDHYLLQTKACDLITLVALKLKRRLLLALSNGDLPYDEEKNKQIYQKYEKYLLPPEEIEWYGLSFVEACRKLKEIEEAKKLASIIPLKQIYRAELIGELKEGKYEKPGQRSDVDLKKSVNWLKKIPGLSKTTTKS